MDYYYYYYNNKKEEKEKEKEKDSTQDEPEKNQAFVPDEKHLDALLDMGFTTNKATRALFFTGNSNLEKAATWAMENNNEKAELPLLQEEIQKHNDSTNDPFSAEIFNQIYGSGTDDYKMVLCVRQDLKMSVGKIAAQCAHGALGVFRRMKQSCPGILRNWERSGEKKVVVAVNSQEELETLERKAITNNLPTHIVRDAGRTQLEPGSRTVLAIAGPAGTVDNVTSHLKLL